MDPKKQELNPELKEIYDRVMNTQVKSEGQPQSAPSQPPPATPQAPSAPPGTVRNPAPPPAGQSDLGGATADAERDPFFSPPPQRAPSTAVSLHSQPGSLAPAGAGAQSAPFVFTGSKLTTSREPNASQSQTYTNKKLSGPIIAVLVAVIIVAWALFWAKFFGII